MIIYGRSNKQTESEIINSPCPHCGHEQRELSIFRGYFYLFWIPTLPWGRDVLLTCPHCQYCEGSKELFNKDRIECSEDQDMIDDIKARRKAGKTPPYFYAGAIIIALIFGAGTWSEAREDHLNKEAVAHFIAEPTINTGLVVRNRDEAEKEFPFLFFYVTDVTEGGREINFVMSDKAYSRISYARKDLEKFDKALEAEKKELYSGMIQEDLYTVEIDKLGEDFELIQAVFLGE